MGASLAMALDGLLTWSWFSHPNSLWLNLERQVYKIAWSLRLWFICLLAHYQYNKTRISSLSADVGGMGKDSLSVSWSLYVEICSKIIICGAKDVLQ